MVARATGRSGRMATSPSFRIARVNIRPARRLLMLVRAPTPSSPPIQPTVHHLRPHTTTPPITARPPVPTELLAMVERPPPPRSPHPPMRQRVACLLPIATGAMVVAPATPATIRITVRPPAPTAGWAAVATRPRRTARRAIPVRRRRTRRTMTTTRARAIPARLPGRAMT